MSGAAVAWRKKFIVAFFPACCVRRTNVLLASVAKLGGSRTTREREFWAVNFVRLLFFSRRRVA